MVVEWRVGVGDGATRRTRVPVRQLGLVQLRARCECHYILGVEMFVLIGQVGRQEGMTAQGENVIGRIT